MPGFRAFENRVTVFLGAVLWLQTEALCDLAQGEPQDCQAYQKEHTVCLHRSNKKSCMTQLLLQNTLLNCYASKMGKYCLKNNTPLKVLLTVDNVPGSSPFIGNLHPNINIVFFPPNTIFSIQPIDRGFAASFKTCYLRRTLHR